MERPLNCYLGRTHSRVPYPFLVLAALTGLLANCGTTKSEPPSAGTTGRSVTVDPMQCPDDREDSAGKVSPETYLSGPAEEVNNATIKLRPVAWRNLSCASADGIGCPDREAAISERQAMNQKQVDCVLAILESDEIAGPVVPVWYEPPQKLVTGLPVPIGTEFSVPAVGAALQRVATHPYVESIVPAFAEAARLGLVPTPIPEECPEAADEPNIKLMDLLSARDQGRVPVAVDLVESVLPPLRSCADSAECDEGIASAWSRSVVSTREVTCVRRFIDSYLQADSARVLYGRAEGDPLAPHVPPFGAPVNATLSFALGMTWMEAYEVAKHPYVQRIWTSDALTFETEPECFGGSQPLVVACTNRRESIVGKLDTQAEAKWQAATSPNLVLITIRRSLPFCEPPACSACPERDLYNEQLTMRSGEAQACVRELITAVGGDAPEAPSIIPDFFSALLTWPQIQSVAAHPDVARIDADDRFSPP